MNSLSTTEINGQLFHLSKDALKRLTLESKCGIVSSVKNYARLSPSIDITTIGNFSPLLCLYRKGSPNYLHSKNSNGFDEDTFKKDISPSTNALMTLCILELIDYYSYFRDIDNSSYSMYSIYKKLSEDQLQFYSINLRNAEGIFVAKKNLLENNFKGFNLTSRDNTFKFNDQGYMMLAYYLYSVKCSDSDMAEEYKNFSLQIAQMFLDFTDKLYECSFSELSELLLIFNYFYSYSNLDSYKNLIIDIGDYLINKFDEKDYYVDSLETTCLFNIALMLSYKHTNIVSFNEKGNEITNKLKSLYSEEKGVFLKLSGKKEVKYSCTDISLYFMSLLIASDMYDSQRDFKNSLSTLYKRFFTNSGILLSWPEAPTLDEYERYRGFSLSSKDMLDESYFRMPNLASPETSGKAPLFNKSIVYSRKKDNFESKKENFDSFKNLFIFYMFIFFTKDNVIKDMELDKIQINKAQPKDEKEIISDLIEELETKTSLDKDLESL